MRGFEWPFEQLPYFVPDSRQADGLTGGPRPHARPYFLFVGRLIQAKGVQTLFPAFSGSDGPDLLIAGDGDYAADLRRLAQGLPRVRFLGRQSHDVLEGLYHHAEAALVPSLCYETFGIVIIEAFAAGTPVIARDLELRNVGWRNLVECGVVRVFVAALIHRPVDGCFAAPNQCHAQDDPARETRDGAYRGGRPATSTGRDTATLPVKDIDTAELG